MITEVDILRGLPIAFLLALFLILLVWSLARAASSGWHRGKQVHFHKIWERTKPNEENNGE